MTFGGVAANQTLTRSIRISGRQFRKGVTAPADVTIGATPTIGAIRFAATNELASAYFSMRPDVDLTVDMILRLQWSLVSGQNNADTLDATVTYTAPTLTTAEGIAKAHTAVTGQITAVTGRLAAGDMYLMDVTISAADGTNPLANAIGLAVELNLTNITGVASADLIDADLIYTALY